MDTQTQAQSNKKKHTSFRGNKKPVKLPKKKMDSYFPKLFDGDEKCRWQQYLIPTLDVPPLRACLEQDVRSLRFSKINAINWARFKLQLIRDDAKWKGDCTQDVYDWCALGDTEVGQTKYFLESNGKC